MSDFDDAFRFAHPRSPVYAPTAMVATSHPLAVQAGLEMLRRGGSAADAAIAAAAVLTVVEPMSTSLGGDAFGIFYRAADRQVNGLNASGRSSHRLSLDAVRQRGLSAIPEDSGLSVNVPGVVDGWARCHERYGRLGWDQVLGPAIGYAEKGFLVTPIVAAVWKKHVQRLTRNPETARVFLRGGRAPAEGTTFCNPDLARSLRLLADNGPEEFYSGSLAGPLVQAVQAAGGVLDEQDLKDHHSDWVTPLSVRYRGHDVLELPPNTQGLAVLLALNLLERQDLSRHRHNSGAYLHLLTESIKLAFADAARYIADPQHQDVPTEALLSQEYTDRRLALIHPQQAQVMTAGRPAAGSDTIYVAVVDGEGNAVSLINSIYRFFGSCITVPRTGFLLQNRGIGFNCNADHPNCVAPRKRSFHTLIPSMVLKEGRPRVVLGVVGAYMQAQAHIQVLANILDFRMNPQTAMDAPRVRFLQGMEVALEKGMRAAARRELETLGHQVYKGQYPDGFGGGQVILVGENGLCGGSDHRKDGCAAGY